METKVVLNNNQNIRDLEKIRYDAYQMDSTKIDYLNTYYARELQKGNFLAFGSFKDENLIAGCYVSPHDNSIYIEQLFVKKEYQEIGLHLGRKLLQYVIDHKEIIESYFNQPFCITKLEAGNAKAEGIYRKMGYRKVGSVLRRKVS